MKTAFFSMNHEQEYRDTSERNARSMPALFSQTFTCRACGKRFPLSAGRKQVVSGRPKYGFRCIDCHTKRINRQMAKAQKRTKEAV